MEASCTICLDVFETDSVIDAAPCGHVFHNECIDSWFVTNRTCPQCRKPLSKPVMIRIYLNRAPYDHSTISQLQETVGSLRAELKDRDTKINKLQKNAKEVESSLTDAKHEVLLYEAAVKHEKLKLKDLSAKIERMKLLEQENKVLSEELKPLRKIKGVVKGCQRDVNEMLCHMKKDASSNTLNELATYCSVLKRELNQTNTDKYLLKEEIRNTKRLLAAKHNELYKDQYKVRELEEQIKQAQVLRCPVIKRAKLDVESEFNDASAYNTPVSTCPVTNEKHFIFSKTSQVD